VFGLVEKSDPTTLKVKKTNGSGVFPAAPSVRALVATILLGLLNRKRQNRQDRACRIELASLGVNHVS